MWHARDVLLQSTLSMPLELSSNEFFSIGSHIKTNKFIKDLYT